MERTENRSKKRRPSDGDNGEFPGSITLDPRSVQTLVAERGRFHRFIASRVGSETEADDLLQESLLRALQRGASLRRDERVVAWFYRILRHAIADHYRQKQKQRHQSERLWTETNISGESRVTPPADWEAAVCACFEGLLSTLKPRYAELLRRIDLRGEKKSGVAASLGLTHATLDVVLHRARYALRNKLEIFCGACSREHCLACACDVRNERRARKV